MRGGRKRDKEGVKGVNQKSPLWGQLSRIGPNFGRNRPIVAEFPPPPERLALNRTPCACSGLLAL
eukprot:2841067-Pyramimonas_sp.AAC.1